MNRLSPGRLLRLDSVRGKVITGTVILILVLLISVLTLLGLSQVNELSKISDERIEDIVGSTVHQIRDALFDEDLEAIPGLVSDLEQASTVYYVAVCDSTGNLFYWQIDTAEIEPVLEHRDFRLALDQRRKATIRAPFSRVGMIRTEVKPVIRFDTFLGMVLVGFEADSIEQSEQRRRWGIVILGIIAIIIGSAFAALLAKNILGPIERLKSAAQRIGEGEFGEMVEVETTDEIGALAETFNTMSLELKKREVEVRRAERLSAIGTTASAIAHEMKTPITSIKTYVDMLPMRFDDPEFRGKFSHTVEDQTTRLIKLIDDLLDYSREIRLHLSDLDLNLQLHLAVGVFRDLMVASRIVVLEDYRSTQTIKGDPDKLEQVFFNLIKNGIEAQGEGGAIAILTLDDDQSVITVVADAGGGVESSTKDSLFEPFVTTKSKGTGLGLAIAKKVVTAHGGEIELFSPQEEIERGLLEQIRVTLSDHWPGNQQGSCFMVRLPAVTKSEN